MTVLYTRVVTEGGSGSTWLGVQEFAGCRVFIAVVDRAGGVSASIETDDPTWPAEDWVLIAQRSTLPGDSGNRRSVYLFESVVPVTTVNPIVASIVLNGAAVEQSNGYIAFVGDIPESFDLAGFATNDNGTVVSASVSTGVVPDIGAGDIFALAAGSARGDSSVATNRFNVTTTQPPNPAGGNWELTTISGSGANARFGALGYGFFPGQAEQDWEDFFNVTPSNRLMSSLLAVFRRVNPEGLIQQNYGTYSPDSNAVPVTLSLPTDPANAIVAFFCGNSIVTPPGGFTVRNSQVDLMGQYLWDAPGGDEAWEFTQGGGSGVWWVGEVAGEYDIAAGQRGLSGPTAATPPVAPSVGSHLLIANVGSVATAAEIERVITGWSDTFDEQYDRGVFVQDSPVSGIATRNVTGDGVTEFSTTATFSSDSFSATAILAAYKLFTGGGDVALPTALENNAAQAISGVKMGNMSPAITQDAGQQLVGIKQHDTPTALEATTALPFAGQKRNLLVTSQEVNTGQPLVGSKLGSVSHASEVTAAMPLVGSKQQLLSVAVENNAALVIVGTKQAVLLVAGEVNTAQQLGEVDSQVLAVATELTQAQEFIGAKIALLPVALEVNLARELLEAADGQPNIFLGADRPVRAFRMVGGELVEMKFFSS